VAVVSLIGDRAILMTDGTEEAENTLLENERMYSTDQAFFEIFTPAIADRLTSPSAIRYIKLGQGGGWARNAFARGVIPFGFDQVPHAPCAAGDWDAVRTGLLAAGKKVASASQSIRELRDFYESDDSCLWVAFANGHLHWAFAETPVTEVAGADSGQPRRERRTIDGWHRHSVAGEALGTATLSSALTRVAGYRMTVCSIDREDYLLRRIRGEPDPLHTAANIAKAALLDVAVSMVAQLDWRDFEIMIDLVFARGGWQRSSALGDGEVDIDLRLDNPTTGEIAWVQIKSTASQATVNDYLKRFQNDGSADRFYFVVHSPKGTLTLPAGRHLHLWAGTGLADRVIAAGLFDWLIERTR
jgi:hypothetical protein